MILRGLLSQEKNKNSFTVYFQHMWACNTIQLFPVFYMYVKEFEFEAAPDGETTPHPTSWLLFWRPWLEKHPVQLSNQEDAI